MRQTGGPSRPWVAVTLSAFALVVLALTTLKSFFTIGLLWKPENQKVRSLELIPLEDIFTATTWFAPVFDYLGNFSFFVPLGMLTAILLGPVRGRLLKVAGLAALFSLTIELTQFGFELGRTDVDDLMFNTLGGLFGAWLASLGGRKWHTLLTILAGLAVLAFAVLVILGPALGDPSKVVPVG
ncbi:VanZ family protein [Corynebacterium sp. A21]|uniref:VanZ family protein n=1 Tax=Corynebacterium sp. A21 TaxID=3457318 RepID=UPI003FD11F01